MIELKVPKYCENCMRFNPVSRQLYGNGEVLHRIINCMYEDECRLIADHIREELTNEFQEKLTLMKTLNTNFPLDPLSTTVDLRGT